MKRLARPRLTYANVIATLALFLALGGGAYAATSIPKASVGTAQLRADSVTGPKVSDGSLVAADFAPGQLPRGAAGETGPEGEAGPAGAPGPKGLQGEAGATGPRGERGPQGERGDDGQAGPRGQKGEPGEDGSRGSQGPTGADGEPGASGPKGDKGARGLEGEPGERGPRGERGPQGERGEEGRQGEPGITRTIVRYGPKVDARRGEASYAQCGKGEAVTGGGFQVLGTIEGRSPYVTVFNRPSVIEELSQEEIEEREREEEEAAEILYPAPPEGGEATGWAVRLLPIESRITFQAYAECAVR
jgi:hypothetical protein